MGARTFFPLPCLLSFDHSPLYLSPFFMVMTPRKLCAQPSIRAHGQFTPRSRSHPRHGTHGVLLAAQPTDGQSASPRRAEVGRRTLLVWPRTPVSGNVLRFPAPLGATGRAVPTAEPGSDPFSWRPAVASRTAAAASCWHEGKTCWRSRGLRRPSPELAMDCNSHKHYLAS